MSSARPNPDESNELQMQDDLSATFSRIGINRDYATMDFSGIREDLQGWASTDPIFVQMLERVKPSLVVEVGTWKGASVVHMAQTARRLNLSTKFICVDTWLGSNDLLWLDPDYRESLMLHHGYPTMFRQFIYNVIASGVAEDVYPLPMTSSAGCYILKRLNIIPDLVYIDAGHEEDEVAIDLKLYYDLLAPGGYMFGDDYHLDWMGVVRAVNRFCADNNLFLTADSGKWSFPKPVQA